MFLAGDVGGTKTYLGLFEFHDGRAQMVRSGAFRTQEYRGLEQIIREFLPREVPIKASAFGVPGAIVNGRAILTNVPWNLNEAALSQEFSFPVRLINDLVATGIGIGVLPPEKFLTLSGEVKPQKGTIALIAAGTGLGESVLYWNGKEHVVQPCEGGMADFAPHDGLQLELLRYLQAELPVVCVERVLSGPGLLSIYRFLRDTGRAQEDPHLSEQMKKEDPASEIAAAAATGNCDIATKTLSLFLSIYGAETGNLALRAVSVGGIYIGGGIASRIAPLMANGIFMKSFLEKDLLSDFMTRISVKVILDDHTGLFGAAQYSATQHSVLEPPA
jgi:glucokinase